MLMVGFALRKEPSLLLRLRVHSVHAADCSSGVALVCGCLVAGGDSRGPGGSAGIAAGVLPYPRGARLRDGLGFGRNPQ